VVWQLGTSDFSLVPRHVSILNVRGRQPFSVNTLAKWWIDGRNCRGPLAIPASVGDDSGLIFCVPDASRRREVCSAWHRAR
jgi:hypothetical protein